MKFASYSETNLRVCTTITCHIGVRIRPHSAVLWQSSVAKACMVFITCSVFGVLVTHVTHCVAVLDLQEEKYT